MFLKEKMARAKALRQEHVWESQETASGQWGGGVGQAWAGEVRSAGPRCCCGILAFLQSLSLSAGLPASSCPLPAHPLQGTPVVFLEDDNLLMLSLPWLSLPLESSTDSSA